MPISIKANEKIQLNHFNRVKNLTRGQTNSVWLWEHKENPQIKIVVKTPVEPKKGLVEHNIKAINAFFGPNSAWPIEGEEGFAMYFYQGQALSKEELSASRTLSKNGLQFTMLDPNEDNYLKSAQGEIIPIDFDYMIIHEESSLLPYQIAYLEGRMGIAMRVGGANETEAANYVINSYPLAKSFLLKNWVNKYISSAPSQEELPSLEVQSKTSVSRSCFGFFKRKPTPVRMPISLSHSLNSKLTPYQFERIKEQVDLLTKEIESPWPYPNKDRKAIKRKALVDLVSFAETFSVKESISKVKKQCPELCLGRISTRTKKLLNTLEERPYKNTSLSL